MTATATTTAPTPTRKAAPAFGAQVKAGDLHDALAWAKHAIPGRPSLPIATCVRLTADGGGVRVEAFDYEIHAAQEISAVGATGEVLVTHRFLRDAIATLPRTTEVHLAVENTRLPVSSFGGSDEERRADFLVVAGAGFEWRIATVALEHLPTYPDRQHTRLAGLSGVELVDLARASRTAGKDETLPLLTGVQLHLHPASHQVETVATDRYRMLHTRVEGTVWAGDPFTALIPARTLALAGRAFARETDVEIRQIAEPGPTLRVQFAAGGRTLSTLTIDGIYPKVLALFPAESPTVVTVDRRALTTAVLRAAVAIERNTPAKLVVTADAVTVSGGWSDTASASGAVAAECTSPTSEPFEVAFNPGYLLEGLALFKTARVALRCTNRNKPVVITPLDLVDDAAPTTAPAAPDRGEYLLMPTRIAG